MWNMTAILTKFGLRETSEQVQFYEKEIKKKTL